MSNPLLDVYNALWDLFEDSKPIVSLIKRNNRIKLGKRTDSPFKDTVSSSDFIELMLIPVGSTPHVQRTSSGSSMIESFKIVAATGKQRVQELYDVKWAIYCAMSNWASILRVLTWNDQIFVVQAKTTSVSDGISDTDLARGVRGWSTIWACEVHMWFNTSQLIEEND